MEFPGGVTKSFTNTDDHDHKAGEQITLELLDEFWFFENLFHSRPRMFMSTTDLWNSIQKMEIENQDAKKSSSSTTDISKENGFGHHNFLRTPSLPPSIGREKAVQEKELNRRSRKLTRQASLSSSKIVPQQRGSEVLYYNQHSSDPIYHMSNNIQEMGLDNKGASGSSMPINSSKESSPVRHNLLRTPSLPSSREDKEFLRRSSKLTRQASLSSSDISPPIHIPKVGLQPATRSPAIPRHRTRKEAKIEGLIKDNKNPPCPTKEVIRRSLSYKKSSSSKIDLEVEEVQGFKDLGFVFDKEEINKSLANIIPGLQEKKQVDHEEDEDEKNKTRRPYLSEAWLVQPSKPTVPNWVDRRSSGDMKEQLKFWARAVASNVRQEC
ncbi:hypothetical protein BVC80_8687g3 [Macleaya cordata]|uniref:Uncharacterized protein n=1 Tax=Macleaya cordata TaxID=56857 RepID=A0A200QL19_MACCD|nr:hypothetical protein BVC80_8687g3 [Macleaya cordata]